MALLDVNVLVALAWDSHVHHRPAREWFAAHGAEGWASCSLTEGGFVRVSSNPAVLPSPITTAAAIGVLAAMRKAGAHRFLKTDVSPTDEDFPQPRGHRAVTDAILLTLARRNGIDLLTFDAGLAELADLYGVVLLST